MGDAISVLIADDHPPTRAGVRAALEGVGFEICAEVGDAKAAVKEALDKKPHVALLDVHMPGNGIAAAAKITASLPQTAVVMLTVSRDDNDLFDALKAGASGYLLKDTDPDRLGNALNGVLNGEAPLPRALVTRVIEEFRGSGQRRVAISHDNRVKLTSREWEVLELMREGLNTDEIAGRLFVAPVTIRSHIASILKKLRVKNREEAIRLLAKT